MSPVANEPDELDDQVLEDEREAAMQEFRERENSPAIEPTRELDEKR